MLLSSETEISIASLVVGNLINWLLHGILTVQIYFYYLAFPNDRLWTKTAVYTVFVIGTIQVISIGVLLVLIIEHGSPYADPLISYWKSLDYKWSPQAFVLDVTGGLVPLIAHCIYVHRISIITQRKVIPILIIILAILQLFAAVLTAVVTIKIVVALCTGFNVVNDLIIAFVMIRNLLIPGYLSKDTKSKITRLVYLIIATGLLTVATNILSFVCVFTKYARVGTAILIFMPKLYANSILVMLNNRKTIRDSQDGKLNVACTHALSALVIADCGIGQSESATSRYGTLATRSTT